MLRQLWMQSNLAGNESLKSVNLILPKDPSIAELFEKMKFWGM
jgi:hypothetical protein